LKNLAENLPYVVSYIYDGIWNGSESPHTAFDMHACLLT